MGGAVGGGVGVLHGPCGAAAPAPAAPAAPGDTAAALVAATPALRVAGRLPEDTGPDVTPSTPPETVLEKSLAWGASVVTGGRPLRGDEAWRTIGDDDMGDPDSCCCCAAKGLGESGLIGIAPAGCATPVAAKRCPGTQGYAT